MSASGVIVIAIGVPLLSGAIIVVILDSMMLSLRAFRPLIMIALLFVISATMILAYCSRCYEVFASLFSYALF